jgi:Sortase domain
VIRAVLVALAAALAVAGCALPDATYHPPPAAGEYIVPAPRPAGPTIAPPLPITVVIPTLDVASDVMETGIRPDGTAEVPPVDTPLVAGWLTESPRPGQPGPAVIYGHVDGNGQPGVFHQLHTLQPGDEVLIGRDVAPAARFEVYDVQRYPKTAFPTELVYGDVPGPELRLVTCGGVFDRGSGHYVDNVVAYARVAADQTT